MIRIITDSTCSLSSEILKKYKIKTATLTFTMDGEEVNDSGILINSDEFYKKIETTDAIGQLKPPSIEKYEEIFTEGVRHGEEDFIVITMSSKNGGSYDAAIKARDSFLTNTRISGIRITVIDSRSMSSSYGYLVMKTAKLREQGIGYEDLVEFAEKYKTRIVGYVCVSDAVSLAKMGFLKTSERKIRRVTDNIVMLSTDNKGMGVMMGHANGIEEVYRVYAEDFMKNVDYELTDFLIVEYSSDISRAEGLRKYIQERTSFKGEIYLSQLSPSGGAMLGLGSVGMSYVTKSSNDAFGDLFRRVGAVTKVSKGGY